MIDYDFTLLSAESLEGDSAGKNESGKQSGSGVNQDQK
jgi:hypothetical protein